MQFFDTHAHIGLIHEDSIEQLVIAQEAKQNGVQSIMSICNNLFDFFPLYENLKKASNIWFAVGVSPSEVQNPGHDWQNQLLKGAALERVVAIGETGLDYFKKFGNKNSQIELFITQLDIARKLQKPVIIHNRDAGEDILNVLSQRLGPKGGVLHCYSEDWNFAKKALELPLYLSFAGNITYRNAKNLHETAVNMPLDRMVVESESPFMIPHAFMHKKRNRPSYLPETVHFIAQLRGMQSEELALILWENSKRLFGIA